MSGYDRYPPRYSNDVIQDYDYPRWAYIILYLLVILLGVALNGLFLLVVSKGGPSLKRTPHYLLATLAVRDIIVCVAVVPFVISWQAVNLYEWTLGSGMCKFFSFLDWATAAAHAFVLLFLLLFLYFWYRKNEAYVNEQGQTIVRQTKMHKWSIPLTWVLGLGLAIPAASVAGVFHNRAAMIDICATWDGSSGSGSGFWFTLGKVLAAFVVPTAVMVFPVIALGMQLSGSREPRLDPPHNRLAMTALGLFIIFLATRAPSEIYTLIKLFSQSGYGLRTSAGYAHTPYARVSYGAEIAITAAVFCACVLDPILYFALNPDYREGLKNAMADMCNKDPAERDRRKAERAQRKQQQALMRQQQRQQAAANRRPFLARNRAPHNARHHDPNLLQGRQPIIIGSGQVPQQYQYTPGMEHVQPLLSPQQQQFNHQMLQPNQEFLDASFESRLSPQLPPVFEYDGLKYIDTARVEPRIGYSPEKTPPKTPETPHYRLRAFVVPGDRGPLSPESLASEVERQRTNSPIGVDRLKPFVVPGVTGPVAPAVAGGEILPSMQSPVPPGGQMEMREISPQSLAQQQADRPTSFQLETLEGSPGQNLRSRRLREDLDESVEVDDALDDYLHQHGASGGSTRDNVRTLDESPGQARRQRQTTQESQQSSGYQSTNGTGVSTSRPTSPAASGVEITITGRTRSRTDLCPDVPRSKFEHSV